MAGSTARPPTSEAWSALWRSMSGACRTSSAKSSRSRRGIIMRADTLRTWLDHLQQTDRLAVIDRQVSLDFELAAVAKHLDGKKAAYFTDVEGHQIPVIAGVASTRQMFAEACETTNYELIQKFAEAVENPRPCSLVDKSEATVKENVILEDIDLMKMLPMPVHHEEDAGNYVTAGGVFFWGAETRKKKKSLHPLP